jgi:hypothetical protein
MKDFILVFPTVVTDMEAPDLDSTLMSGLYLETLYSVIQALDHVLLHVSVDGVAAELWQGLYHADSRHNIGHDGVMIMTKRIFQTCLQNLGAV